MGVSIACCSSLWFTSLHHHNSHHHHGGQQIFIAWLKAVSLFSLTDLGPWCLSTVDRHQGDPWCLSTVDRHQGLSKIFKISVSRPKRQPAFLVIYLQKSFHSPKFRNEMASDFSLDADEEFHQKKGSLVVFPLISSLRIRNYGGNSFFLLVVVSSFQMAVGFRDSTSTLLAC